MRKIFSVLFLFFALQMNCFAQTGVTFLYINGSNNNDEKMKNWYENGVKLLHPQLKGEFERNTLSQKYFLRNEKYYINEEPKIFFWGDKSRRDLDFVEQDLEISKIFSPLIAFKVRQTLAHFLHDAVWVQKYHNMAPILDELHESIRQESEKGNKVVLYGYSAGSFITFEYLLSRMPYINVADFFDKVGASEEEKDFVAQNPMKNTCMAALSDSKLAAVSITGEIIPNLNPSAFKKNYINLDQSTDTVCDRGEVRGIINFASPLVLFYSDLSDPNFQITYYNRLLFKYIIENDLFWITVNYREDPLGFPCGRNLTIEEIENLANLAIEPHAGFMYDLSDTPSKRTFIEAHTAYWSTRKTFSKAVVKAYVNGYRHQYDENFKPKKIEQYKKKLNLTP